MNPPPSPETPAATRGWAMFPAVYCINLKERDDRLAQAQAEFAAVGLERVCFFRPERRKDVDEAITDSHMACLRRALDEGAPYVLVFEDDAEFAPDCQPHLERVFTFLRENPHWQIFHLGGFIFRRAERLNRHIVRGGMMTVHAYVIRADLARRALELRPFSKGMSIDLFYQCLIGNDAYCHVYPPLCVQRASASDGSWDKSGKNKEGWLADAIRFTSLDLRDKLRFNRFSWLERLKIRNGMTFFIVFRAILRRKLRKAVKAGKPLVTPNEAGDFVLWEAGKENA